MQFATLNPIENRTRLLKKSSVDAFKAATGEGQIKQGMSPEQIADIISDHLMNIVRKQFDEARAQIQKKK